MCVIVLAVTSFQPSDSMKHLVAVVAACVVLAFHLHLTEGQGFSFSLPGKWGGAGKRSQVPWLKQGLGECGQYDPSLLLDLYRIIQVRGHSFIHTHTYMYRERHLSCYLLHSLMDIKNEALVRQRFVFIIL